MSLISPSLPGGTTATSLMDHLTKDSLLDLISVHLPVLELSLSFTMTQELYLDLDLTHNTAIATGLSEDRLILENLVAKETLANSLMLVSIMKYR